MRLIRYWLVSLVNVMFLPHFMRADTFNTDDFFNVDQEFVLNLPGFQGNGISTIHEQDNGIPTVSDQGNRSKFCENGHKPVVHYFEVIVRIQPNATVTGICTIAEQMKLGSDINNVLSSHVSYTIWI
jgi:hypothetical protein